ncbi:MAG: hypothetical protein IPM77_11390 [Crocinitomicaceae bacterium]|nr:hypothetical protein [Crocinitomicaceae bacterium]
MKLNIFIVYLSAFVSFSQSDILYPENWKFKRDIPIGSHTPNPEMAANVPGVVHLDLMRSSGFYPDFYSGNKENLRATKYIESLNWVYTGTLQVDSATLSKNNQKLVFEGLDTYAHVYLNDSLILQSDNMFIKYEVPVKGIIKAGENKLKIYFTSPLIKHEAEVMEANYELPSGNETVDLKVSSYT